MKTERKQRHASWRNVCVALLLGACGGAVGQPTVGGESHFLRHCGDGCGPGLECVSDVCTRSCRIDDASACQDLSPAAQCTNASIEPGAIAVCDQECSASGDCSARGSGFTCEVGYCRGPLPAGSPEPTPSGSEGAGAAPSVAGTGGTSGPGGETSAGGTSSPGGATSAGGATSTGGVGQMAPDRCLLPFKTGSCKAAISVFAFIDGACQPAIYGGCDGNANLFQSQEECLSACELRPLVKPCADGRVERDICIACGAGGGCAQMLHACAQPCEAQTRCETSGFVCSDSVCQLTGCI